MHTDRRQFGISVIAIASLLLTGCFTGEDDGIANEILFNTAHPLKTGPGRICALSRNDCMDIRIVRDDSKTSGYMLSLPQEGVESPLFMRALKGAGIPPDTYVMMSFGDEDGLASDAYGLALASRQSDGGWLIMHPECAYAKQTAIEEDFPWVRLEIAFGTPVCRIASDGLTDARLYTTLSALTNQDEKFRLYEGG
ncbi:hypothetical protein CHX26_14990 [Porphyrobacter sp. HT-58-2]|uniref:hypothetical protein n=1 Tax=Porphyrobacter sp. HT-58-2 TaxID=2023229 RepID=UPI000CDBCFAF|nr:hypothetical protein [Porphyrobacter sp. HT-58-2]AUX70626.1 hypothetical protein CHX26_14990 [Porphyrobacter sp. HT-58-2]